MLSTILETRLWLLNGIIIECKAVDFLTFNLSMRRVPCREKNMLARTPTKNRESLAVKRTCWLGLQPKTCLRIPQDEHPPSVTGSMTKSSMSGRRSTKKETKTALNDNLNPKITFKNQRKHKSLFEKGGLPENTRVYYISGELRLEGRKKGHGIICSCCDSQFSASKFEAHAGFAFRRKPYEYIFLSNGVSLHDYASSLKINSKEPSAEEPDEVCTVCREGGDLLLCDGCPRVFHKECTSKSRIHQVKWFCKYCQNTMKCVGEDEIKEIDKRGFKIAHNPDQRDLVACALCREYDFNENGFSDRTVIVCEQCEKEYHIGCLRKRGIADLKELPRGKWFCRRDCKKLQTVLKVLVTSGPEKVPRSFINLIRQKSKNRNADRITNLNVKWVLIRGKDASAGYRMLLEEAVDIFHCQFDPIVDSLTGSDFIQSMAYGLKMGSMDFAGVHCAMLTINSKVVTAGMFRVFGKRAVELPIVATCQSYQGKGYFQLFFSCFEKLLSYLEIQRILVPAAENAKPMWTDKFGFREVIPILLSKYKQTQTSMVAFDGTTWLEKVVPVSHITYKDRAVFSLLDFV